MAWFQTQTRTRICFTLCNACSSLLPNSRNHCTLTARWSRPTSICAQGFAEPLRCHRSLHALLMSNFFCKQWNCAGDPRCGSLLAASIMMLLGPMHGKRKNFWCITTRIIQELPWLARQLGSDKTEGWHGKRPDQVAPQPGTFASGHCVIPICQSAQDF